MTASDARPPSDGEWSRLHRAAILANTRPPSDTGTTGWHMHASGISVMRDGMPVCRGEQSHPVLVVDPVVARETIAAPIALARCQDVHANDTGNACRACQSFAQVVALRVLAALGSQGQR